MSNNGIDVKKAVAIMYRGMGSSFDIAAALNDPEGVKKVVVEASDDVIYTDTPQGRASIAKKLLIKEEK